jgi:hypothetical protein
MVGGPEEAAVIALFRKLNPKYQESEDSEDEQAKPRRRSFSREAKLQAIKYVKHTWIVQNDGTLEPISRYYAAAQLEVSPIMLKNWETFETRILHSTRGTRRCIIRRTAKYPELSWYWLEASSHNHGYGYIPLQWLLRLSNLLLYINLDTLCILLGPLCLSYQYNQYALLVPLTPEGPRWPRMLFNV